MLYTLPFSHGAEASQHISEASRTASEHIQLSLHHLQQGQLRYRKARKLDVALRRARAIPTCRFNSGISVIIASMTLFY